jgi:C4-dicarboxylate-binding protein DctP
MKRFRRLKVSTALWIIILIIAAQPLHGVAQSLKFGYTAPAGSPLDTSARQLATEVERASNGKLKVAVFPAGSLGPAGAVMDQVQNGSIDFALIPTPLLARSVQDFEVFELPFLFEDYGAVRRFQSSDAGVNLLQRLEGFGLKGLAYWHGPMKVIAAKKPVTNPSDLKGLKLAQQGPKTRDVIAFERLGANVTSMQFAEVYNALQTGVVDAAESTIPAIEQARLFEVDKYVTVTNHSYVAYVVVSSMKTWSSLSPQDQGVVEKAITKVTPEANSLVVNQLGETFKAVSGRAEFKTLSGAQRDAWRHSVDFTWKEFSTSSSREELVRFALASGTGGGGDPCRIDQCRCSDRSCSEQCCSK